MNKNKRSAPVRRQLLRWTAELRAIIARAQTARRVRGGLKALAHFAMAPLFLSRLGKRVRKLELDA